MRYQNACSKYILLRFEMCMITGQQVPAEQLTIGSLIMVKPGDGVPADATVVSGASRKDESMLTGEPAPVSKRKDDKVTWLPCYHYGIIAQWQE